MKMQVFCDAVLPDDRGKASTEEQGRALETQKGPTEGREKLLRGQGQHDPWTKNVAQPGEQDLVEVCLGSLPEATKAGAGQVVPPGTPGVRAQMLQEQSQQKCHCPCCKC